MRASRGGDQSLRNFILSLYYSPVEHLVLEGELKLICPWLWSGVHLRAGACISRFYLPTLPRNFSLSFFPREPGKERSTAEVMCFRDYFCWNSELQPHLLLPQTLTPIPFLQRQEGKL